MKVKIMTARLTEQPYLENKINAFSEEDGIQVKDIRLTTAVHPQNPMPMMIATITYQEERLK